MKPYSTSGIYVRSMLAAPVRVIQGSNTSVIDRQICKTVRRNVGHSTHTLIDGAGHMLLRHPESREEAGLARDAVQPRAQWTSMSGVVVRAQSTRVEARTAEAVIVGSGTRTREAVASARSMRQIELDPSCQLIAAQRSGTLILAKLGLLDRMPACTDLTTRPWVQDAGIEVLDQPFFADGNVATAGGWLASPYLAAWSIARLQGGEVAAAALHDGAPVGEKASFVQRALDTVSRYLPARAEVLTEGRGPAEAGR